VPLISKGSFPEHKRRNKLREPENTGPARESPLKQSGSRDVYGWNQCVRFCVWLLQFYSDAVRLDEQLCQLTGSVEKIDEQQHVSLDVGEQLIHQLQVSQLTIHQES